MTDLPVVYGHPPKDLSVEVIDCEPDDIDLVVERPPQPEPKPKRKNGRRK